LTVNHSSVNYSSNSQFSDGRQSSEGRVCRYSFNLVVHQLSSTRTGTKYEKEQTKTITKIDLHFNESITELTVFLFIKNVVEKYSYNYMSLELSFFGV